MADETYEQFHRSNMSGRISMPYGSIPEPSGLGMVMLQLWHAIRRYRRLFLGCCVLVWITGTLILVALRPVYTASATVAIAAQSVDPLAPVGQEQADQFQDDDLPQTIAAAMQSREVAAAVLAQLPAAWPKPTSNDPALVQQAAIDDFLKRLTVTAEVHSRIIDVDVRAKTALLAQALANAVVTNYQNISLDQQTAQSDHVTGWLVGRTQDLQRRWLAAVQAANDYRSDNHITDANDNAATVPLIDQEISQTATSLEAAQSQLIAAQAQHDSGHGDVAAEQPAYSANANMLAQLETTRAQLAGEFGPNYPKVATLDAQIAALRSTPAAFSAAPPISSGSNLAVARMLVDSLSARLDQLTQLQAADGLTQANYLTLKAEADNAHTAYSTFVEHAAEVADRATLLQPAISLVSAAGLPLRPSFPDRPKLGLGVFLLGLIAGAGACMIKDHSRQFESAFNPGKGGEVPLLAALNFVAARAGRNIAHHMLDDPYSRTSEAMRGIINALSLLANRPGRGRCILIASAGAQEGRSTVASWLASIVQQNGEKVLLLGAGAETVFTGSTAPMKLGLADIIFGNVAPEQVIETDPVTGVDMISAGSLKAPALESQDMIRVGALLTSLQSKYALIVIDSLPLLNSADGLMWSTAVDEVIFICRWQHSAPRAVNATIDRLQAKGAHVAGIVVSMVGKNADLTIEDEYSGRELSLMTRLYGA